MIPEGEVGCKICDKSIYRIFVEHVQVHLLGDKEPTVEERIAVDAIAKVLEKRK